MATVPFTTTCDVEGCGRRCREYSSWHRCRTCDLDICDLHDVPSERDEDIDGAFTQCKDCAALELQEAREAEAEARKDPRVCRDCSAVYDANEWPCACPCGSTDTQDHGDALADAAEAALEN